MRCRVGRNQLIILWLTAIACAASAQTGAEPAIIPVPLYAGTRYLGEIPVQFTADDTPLIRPSNVIELLRDQVSDDYLAAATALFPSPDWKTLSELSQLGVRIALDWDTLSLTASIPPEMRRPEMINVSGTRPPPRGTEVEPAAISFVANLDLWSRYHYEARLLDAAFTPEVAVNFNDVVLEAKGGLRTGTPVLFLDHARVIHDFSSIGYRLEAGDLTYLDTKLSGVSGITGVSFVRRPALGGFAERLPVGGAFLQEIALQADTDLTVTLNDSRIQNRRLPAGNYLVTGFPVVQGLNTITISWEDAGGLRDVEFVVPYDPELMRAGELDAGIAAGIAERDITRPVVASYQTIGLTDFATFGLREGIAPLNLQTDLGMIAIVAARAGTFTLSPDALFGPSGRLDIDVPLRYRFLDSRRSSYRSFGLSAGVATARADAAAALDTSIYTSGFFNLVFADGFSITPRAYYSYGVQTGVHVAQFRAGLRKAIRGGSSLAADVGIVYDETPGFIATVSYSASFPEKQQNLFMQQDLDAQKFSAYWSRYAGENQRDVDFSASAQVPVDFNDMMNLNAQVGYTNEFLRMALTHGLTSVINESQLINSTSARIQAAVVMADGEFGLTVPVSDSFVIVLPGEQTRDVPLRVNRRAAGTAFNLRAAGSVLPNLSSYEPTEISVEPQDLVLGSDESELQYFVVPGYRSGAVVRVELPRNIYVGGVLAGPDGTPLTYQFGRWERVGSGPGEPAGDGVSQATSGSPGEFFTDENGYFEIYSLSPGDYRLSIVRFPSYEFSFTVSPDADEFLDLETVQARVVR